MKTYIGLKFLIFQVKSKSQHAKQNFGSGLSPRSGLHLRVRVRAPTTGFGAWGLSNVNPAQIFRRQK